jgi:hypothetical protein
MTSFGEATADDQPELADVGRLARKLVHRAVRTARTEDRPLRRALLDHLGPDAATLPAVSDICPLYEQANLQVGLDAWLAGPGREHEAIGITGVTQMRFTDVTIGDLIQAPPGSTYDKAGVGAPVALSLPCGPDGQTMPCVINGIYLVREGAERLTTNRADLLEPALAARPGRVDLAAELPLPDADARRALLRLYQGSLVLDSADLDQVVGRTDGTTEPFLRELLRKAALLAAEADLAAAAGTGEADGPDGPIRVTGAQLTTALDQLLDSRSQLTRVLLGGQPQ